MPFHDINCPSTAFSLLKEVLCRNNFKTEIMYLNLEFSHLIGNDLYRMINTNMFSMPGDWLFSNAIFYKDDEEIKNYFQYVQNNDQQVKSQLKHRGSNFNIFKRCLKKSINHIKPFIDNSAEKIISRNPKIVGFTSINQQHTASIALARKIKQINPNIITIMGGPNCEGIMGQETKRCFSSIDAVVSGAGEVVLPEIVKKVFAGESFDELKGVYTKRNVNSFTKPQFSESINDLDDLPYSNYDDFFEQLLNYDEYKNTQLRLWVEMSRGCWWGQKKQCIFCGLNGNNIKYQHKSPKRALSELTYIIRKYQDKSEYLNLYLADNILATSYFKNVIQKLSLLENKIRMGCEIKVTTNKEWIESLQKANFIDIQPGIESLNDKILKTMNKGTSAINNIQMLKWSKLYGLRVYWNILSGFPGENSEDYRQINKIIDDISHLPPPMGLSVFRMQRFSPAYKNASEFKFKILHPRRAYNYIYPFSNEKISNLAYNFDHILLEDKDPSKYSYQTKLKVFEWQRNYKRSDLIYFDNENIISIWDFRFNASKIITILEEPARSIFLECDKTISSNQILNHFRGESEVCIEKIQEVLSTLSKYRLLMKVKTKFLSLVIPVDIYQPNEFIMNKIEEFCHEKSIDEVFRLCSGNIRKIYVDNKKLIECLRFYNSKTCPNIHYH